MGSEIAATSPPGPAGSFPAKPTRKTTKRTLTRRGVVWIGQTCNLRCYFCYFLNRIADSEHPEHPVMGLKKCKEICNTLRYFYGNTAIDIAAQTKRLGAEDVTIVYRRGPAAMGATPHEQKFAQTSDVRVRHWARPRRVIGADGHVREVEFERTRDAGQGRIEGTGETYALPADMLFTAIGQTFVAGPVSDGGDALDLNGGRIQVDAEGATSVAGVFAGGDCVSGEDLTVQAVEDGKVAAFAIDRYLRD